MKKIKILIITLFGILVGQLQAQEGYTYTLIENGGYSYSIAAVPNTSASNFATSVQSYGFTITVPDGVTLGITSSLGGGGSDTFFNGTDVAQPTIDGYLITETLGGPTPLPAPSAGTTTPLVTIQVNGSPTNGVMSILANNSALATSVTPLKSFMQADMIDDAMVIFTNVVDPNAAAVSGTSTFDFSTLSVEEEELVEFLMYPNPASDIVTFKIPEGNKIIKIEIFDALGKQILLDLTEENTIDITDLSLGYYLVSVITDKGKITKKLIKN